MKGQGTAAAEFLENALRDKDEDFLRELHAFPKYVPRQSITRFLGRYELFKMTLSVPGSVVEAGVFSGAGVFSFAQFSAILEPVHYARKVIGFDTFEGFMEFNQSKDAPGASIHGQQGGFAYQDLGTLKRAITQLMRIAFWGRSQKSN